MQPPVLVWELPLPAEVVLPATPPVVVDPMFPPVVVVPMLVRFVKPGTGVPPQATKATPNARTGSCTFIRCSALFQALPMSAPPVWVD
jgi:hypothetical protein